MVIWGSAGMIYLSAAEKADSGTFLVSVTNLVATGFVILVWSAKPCFSLISILTAAWFSKSYFLVLFFLYRLYQWFSFVIFFMKSLLQLWML